jgi:1-deoxy-D-xylulose-5-phosphate synthase
VEIPDKPSVLPIGVAEVLQAGEGVALVGYGFGAVLAQQTAELVAEVTGAHPTVVNARFAKPLDGGLMRQLAARHDLIVTIEDHAVTGGFGSAVLEALADTGARVLTVGLPDRFIDHGKRDLLLRDAGLTPEAIAARVVAALNAPSRTLTASG